MIEAIEVEIVDSHYGYGYRFVRYYALGGNYIAFAVYEEKTWYVVIGLGNTGCMAALSNFKNVYGGYGREKFGLQDYEVNIALALFRMLTKQYSLPPRLLLEINRKTGDVAEPCEPLGLPGGMEP